jgi:hypothetical protein
MSLARSTATSLATDETSADKPPAIARMRYEDKEDASTPQSLLAGCAQPVVVLIAPDDAQVAGSVLLWV